MPQSALVSLTNTLELILRSDRFQFFHGRQHVISLYRKVRILQSLLHDYPENTDEETNYIETQIRGAAYTAEDLIEWASLQQFLMDHQRFMARLNPDLRDIEYIPENHNSNQMLEDMIKDFDSIVDEVMYERCGLKGLLSTMPKIGSSSRPARSDEAVMVGFNEDMMVLKDRLTGQESTLKVIPITGMGGIGKTTLARNLFKDSLIEYHFDARAWVTISPTYSAQEVVVELLTYIGVDTDNQQEKSLEDLKHNLFKNLKGMRYLIVLDDMWHTDVWDDLKRLFPNDVNGSRIVLTTRLMEVAVYVTSSSSPPHEVCLLDEDESWDLLCQHAYKNEDCPPELEKIGRVIAKNCRGLPLATSVIGGVLACSTKTQEFWKYVAENVNSIAIETDEHCSEILSLSYNHLPHHLKPCFLYFGLFPEDYKISAPKLIKLWVAEGFLKPVRSKGFEEAAEEYLKNLIERNLVFVRRRGSNGSIKTLGVHDIVRDLCIKEAQKKDFLLIINRNVQTSPRNLHIQRLSMNFDILEENDISDDMLNAVKSAVFARSLMCTRRILIRFPIYDWSAILRILDFLGTPLYDFPDHILRLLNLRYLALGFKSFPLMLPPELSQIWKLQTLLLRDNQSLASKLDHVYSEIPSEILQMTQLRHLQITKCYLPNPIDANHPIVLKHLQTLSTVSNFRCTEEVLKKFPNLRKLGVNYNASGISNWSEYHLENLARFSKLKSLKCVFNRIPRRRKLLLNQLMFPQSLKKLSLTKCGFCWKDMSSIGFLPNLEVLKLIDDAFKGEVWEPAEGGFCRLKYLVMKGIGMAKWIADKEHFPSLQQLIISLCFNLEEIPSGIGDIETLRMIEIDNFNPSLINSVERIIEDQQSMENNVLHVRVRSWKRFSEVVQHL